MKYKKYTIKTGPIHFPRFYLTYKYFEFKWIPYSNILINVHENICAWNKN